VQLAATSTGYAPTWTGSRPCCAEEHRRAALPTPNHDKHTSPLSTASLCLRRHVAQVRVSHPTPGLHP
jgi:hypothetical protein